MYIVICSQSAKIISHSVLKFNVSILKYTNVIKYSLLYFIYINIFMKPLENPMYFSSKHP